MRSARWGLGLVGLVGVHGVALAATFYVDADNGDDTLTAAQAQSMSTPWKTLTRATTEGTVAAGDTISMAAGTYDEALGETFPLTLLDGVSIEGAGDDTLIFRSTEGYVFAVSGTPLSSDTKLSSVKLDGNGAYGGVWFEKLDGPTAPVISNTTFGPGLNDGVSLSQSSEVPGSFSATVTGNRFDARNWGFVANWNGTGDFTPTVDGNTFATNYSELGVFRSGQNSGALVSPLVSNNTFTGSGYSALSLSISEASGSTVFTPVVVGNDITNGGDNIYFAADYTYGDVTAGLTVANNTITGGSHGVYVYLSSVSSEATLTGDYTISGNTLTGQSRTAISMELSELAGRGTVDLNFLVANNTVTNTDSTAIEFSASTMTGLKGSLDVTIAGNTISGAQYEGISVSLSSMSEATLDVNVLIAGNTVTDVGYDGIYAYAESQSSLTSDNWEISDNVVSGAGDYGLYTDFTDVGVGGARIMRNTLTGNHIAAGVDGVGGFSDFGGGASGSPGLNDFSGSTSEFDFENGTPDLVMAHDNLWGSTVLADIDARINDDEEDTGGNTGDVDIGTARATAATRTATIDLTSAILTDVAPTGLSVGDVIRYTATATATGDLGCGEAEITGTVPASTTYVADSAQADGKVSVALTGDAHVGVGVVAPGTPVAMRWDVTVGDAAACDELAATATLKCAPLADIDSTPVTGTVGVTEEIPNDGIDQDCNGADLVVEDTDVADTDGGIDTDATPPKAKCGCDDASPMGGTWLMGLAAVGLLRRRRQ